MAQTFFFYDLETSGVNPRSARVMQFAGQRTSIDLQPIGEPVNVLIKLTPDVVPEPDAILVTGITPQKTLQEGVTEAEFLKLFCDKIAIKDTIFVGFNTVRFDDEFMRFMLYRNFYDPYDWQWKDGKSRWDLLDVVRMTRALRPDGIKWPVDTNGKSTNRLELLTAINGLDHIDAHDALSDVKATIALAQLIRGKQPKLFEYLLTMRDKKKAQELVAKGTPFVYSSGKYPSEFEKTTVAQLVVPHPTKQCAYVFDLRHDPAQYKDYTPEQLAEAWKWKKDSTKPRLPVKALRFNCCPAVAPVSVLDEPSKERLKLDMNKVQTHAKTLAGMSGWPEKLLKAVEILDKAQQASFLSDQTIVDGQLYDGFFDDHDRNLERAFRTAPPNEFQKFIDEFHDQRLKALIPLYKARNYPGDLTDEERATWERYLAQSLMGGGVTSKLAKYFSRLEQLAAESHLTQNQRYLLEELQLYGQSIMPAADEYGSVG
jgi:exodeoxyribonuclease-1